MARAGSAQETEHRGEVPPALLPHQRHGGTVRQGGNHRGGCGPVTGLPEPPVPGERHASRDEVPEQEDARR